MPPLTCQVCWTKYGSYPVHRAYCHEGAVRILLACLESHANRCARGRVARGAWLAVCTVRCCARLCASSRLRACIGRLLLLLLRRNAGTSGTLCRCCRCTWTFTSGCGAASQQHVRIAAGHALQRAACLRSEPHAVRGLTPLLLPPCWCVRQVFVRVYTSAAEVKCSASKLAYVWQSQGCDSWWLQPVGQVVTKGKSTKHLPGPGPAPPSNRCARAQVLLGLHASCVLRGVVAPVLLCGSAG